MQVQNFGNTSALQQQNAADIVFTVSAGGGAFWRSHDMFPDAWDELLGVGVQTAVSL